MEYVLAIVEETTRACEEWKKSLKKFGANDRRTVEIYNRYLGLDRARQIVMEILEGEQE